MQKHVNLVDLVKSFPTNIFLQYLASIQKRTSPLTFAHLAEKSEYGSVSNLSTKVEAQLASLRERRALLVRHSRRVQRSDLVPEALTRVMDHLQAEVKLAEERAPEQLLFPEPLPCQS